MNFPDDHCISIGEVETSSALCGSFYYPLSSSICKNKFTPPGRLPPLYLGELVDRHNGMWREKNYFKGGREGLISCITHKGRVL